MSNIFFKIDKFIVKYFGFILYPTHKLGKEDTNKKIHEKYK